MNGQNSWNKIEETSKAKARSSPNGEKKKNSRRPLPRPHETEEEAILRRFHDAQRMARFRAKKKKAIEDAKALEAAKLTEMTMITELKRRNVVFQIKNTSNQGNFNQCESPVKVNNNNNKNNDNNNNNDSIKRQESSLTIVPTVLGQSKYSQLLGVIEELGRDIRLTYAGSRSSAERLKMGIIQARMLVRDCLLETEINSRQ